MSDDIKKLIERLRATYFEVRDFSLHDVRDAANALEAMAEKLQRETKAAGYWMERFCAAENERDRMRSALETIAEGRDSGRHDGLPEEHPAHSAVLMHFIACEALEGREWERFRNEKVAGGPTGLEHEAQVGSVSSPAPATDPEVVRDTPVCIWVSHISKDRSGHLIKDGSGRYSYSWVICDGTHVQYCADNMPCFVCGRPIKFAGGG